jgi:hypothetical protein
MGRVVIACYRPKKGKEGELRKLVSSHVDILREQGLVTSRVPVIMQAEDHTIIEIFEWKSPEAIEHAHHNESVQGIWNEFAEISDFVKPSEISECDTLFSEFSPLN